MNNRPYDYKRGSLDVSDTSSDEGEYNMRSSSNQGGAREGYTSQDQLYSPESHSLEGSAQPRSMRENNGSASNGKKNIIINENRNEFHRINQEKASDLSSPEGQRSSSHPDSKYSDYIRGNKSGQGISDKSDQSPDKQESSGEDEEEYGTNLSSKYAKEDNNTKPAGFKNRLLVGRKQEDDYGMSSKAIRESADQVREKWLMEKAKRNLESSDSQEKVIGQRSNQDSTNEYKSRPYDKYEESRDREYKSSDKKNQYASGDTNDPGAKFEKIEDKISRLEKDLKNYSKSLVQSAVKEEEKSQNLSKSYKDFEDRMNHLKEEINQSIGHKRSGYNYESDNLEGSKRSKLRSSVSQSSNAKKSGNRSSSTKKSKSSALKIMKQELERLRDENEELKERVIEKEMREREKTIKANPGLIIPHISRERELLDTIERIKKKLRKSITKKMQDEKERAAPELIEEASAKLLGTNFTSYGLHYKDVLKRKTIEDKIDKKMNCQLLHKGLPTGYKNYEGPIFIERMTKTKK